MQLSVIINNVGIKISVGMNVKKLYYKGRCERRFIWNPPSKHFLVLKTSWRHILKTSWRHVLKTSSRQVLKMFWGHILKTSWRHYWKKQNTYWGYLYLTNLNVYLTNLYFTNLYLTILRRIQNALIRTQ